MGVPIFSVGRSEMAANTVEPSVYQGGSLWFYEMWEPEDDKDLMKRHRENPVSILVIDNKANRVKIQA